MSPPRTAEPSVDLVPRVLGLLLVCSRTVALVVALVVALLVPGPAGYAASRAERYSAPLPRAIRDLPRHAEVREGYDRDLFKHWVDADGDGCDTREEVLVAESVDPVTVGAGCSLSGGRWRSYYDGEVWTDTGDLDIDHLVPLAEAWDSGARSWSDGARRRYANDLRDRRALVAVTDNVNASKGDRDLAEWLPELHQCRYLRQWVAIKHRWALSTDRPERRAMRALAGDCGEREVSVRLAR